MRMLGLLVGIVGVVLTIPAAMIAMGGFFAFDAPGSTANGLTWAFAAGLWAAPVVTVLMAAAGFLSVVTGARAWLWVALILPLVWIVYCAGVLLLLQKLCGGRFGC